MFHRFPGDFGWTGPPPPPTHTHASPQCLSSSYMHDTHTGTILVALTSAGSAGADGRFLTATAGCGSALPDGQTTSPAVATPRPHRRSFHTSCPDACKRTQLLCQPCTATGITTRSCCWVTGMAGFEACAGIWGVLPPTASAPCPEGDHGLARIWSKSVHCGHRVPKARASAHNLPAAPIKSSWAGTDLDRQHIYGHGAAHSGH